MVSYMRKQPKFVHICTEIHLKVDLDPDSLLSLIIFFPAIITMQGEEKNCFYGKNITNFIYNLYYLLTIELTFFKIFLAFK